MLDILGNILSAFILYIAIYLVSIFISKTMARGLTIALIISVLIFVISFLDAYGLSNKVSAIITQVIPLWIVNKYAWKLAYYSDDEYDGNDTYNDNNYSNDNYYYSHKDYHSNDDQGFNSGPKVKPSPTYYNDSSVTTSEKNKKVTIPRPKFSFNNRFTTLHKQDSKYNQILNKNKQAISRLIIQTNETIEDTERVIEALGSNDHIYPKVAYEQFKTDFANFKYDRWNQIRGNYGENVIANHITKELHLVPLTNVILPMNYGQNQSTNQIDVLLVCTKGIFAFEAKNYNADHIEIRGKLTKNGKYEYETVFNYAKNKNVSIPVQYIYNDKHTDAEAINYQTIGHQTYMHKQAIIYNLMQYNSIGLVPEKLENIVHSPLVYINNSNLSNKDFYRGNKLPQERNDRVVGIASNEINEWIRIWHNDDVLSPQQVEMVNRILVNISQSNEEKRYDHYLFNGGPNAYTQFIDSWIDFNNEIKAKYL